MPHLPPLNRPQQAASRGCCSRLNCCRSQNQVGVNLPYPGAQPRNETIYQQIRRQIRNWRISVVKSLGNFWNSLFGMPKSASELDLRKRFNGLVNKKKGSNDSSPQSQSSVSSIPENAMFDTIGERPAVKKHMKLGDVGKTRSCVEFKTNDKRLLRTFQEDNIIKMPSMDSDIGNEPDTGVADLCLSFEGLGKSLIYSQSDDNGNNDVKEKKKSKK